MPPYSYRLRTDHNDRITEKIETVAGKSVTWAYGYDEAGRLIEARLGNRLICQCWYDKEGRRQQDYFPASHDSSIRCYEYRQDNRLTRVENCGYIHDDNGFRSQWSNGSKYTMYEYAPDYRLLKAEWPGEAVFEFTHDKAGQRKGKYRDSQLVEGYEWFDFLRLSAFFDGETAWRLVYEGDQRTPCAMERIDGAMAYLYYDQVGSLRVVVDSSGNVIKEILYDPFGGIMEDTAPDFRIPLGFAGGLHDRDLGFVRFGWRDYDTFTSRFTALDPMGDAGGDDDWYGYCLDDPVNMNDPLGLFPPFSQKEKNDLKRQMVDKLSPFEKFTQYPLDVFGCFPACHDMKEKKQTLAAPPRKSGGADREIRKQKPEDISHIGTWWDNIID